MNIHYLYISRIIMPANTKIEWTDGTWNPVTGCTKVSPGCAHCYAETITLRFKRGGPFLPGLTTIKIHPDRLELPLTWKKPRRIFVNSMSDLFHDDVPLSFIQDVFSVMRRANRHTFQILTKRHDRLEQISDSLEWPGNVWIGVSVENQYWAEKRIPILTNVPAAVRFLSVEPLLKRTNLLPFLEAIDWVIVGGESGNRCRPLDIDWVRSIRDDCLTANVPFFFKQWGGRNSKARGRILDNRTWDEVPELIPA